MMVPPGLQYALPHRLLSRLVMWATRWRFRPFKNFLIRRIVAAYGVDLEEAASADPGSYPHFNAFFTRALKPGARAIDADPHAVVMPADGRISQLGRITGERIFQAKGHDFEVAALLADAAAAGSFAEGHFATVYLSPRDYHRVHMPWAGRLLETVHVPGRLFSVAPHAVAGIPGLFARNERLVCRFECDFGPMAVVMVGAMLVSGVETVWRGVEIPPYARRIVRRDYRDRELALEKGAEMARFNMGSTVVVLLPDAGFELEPSLGAEHPVRLGQRLAMRCAR
ncbi:MAG TPA: archaetidylserine decarboxylase [Xanthomonadaceae bacterium]|nr:archaetidylserine decarboxylase [Xanthomonadaceae bacterium]